MEYFKDKFSFLNKYAPFVNRDKPLPVWSSADVEQFIASDPVHGPTLKTAREAAMFAATGSAIGAVTTAGYCFKHSKSLHGAGLALVAGTVFGYTFGHEIANHWFQLYKLDTLTSEVKFLEWWENKTAGRL